MSGINNVYFGDYPGNHSFGAIGFSITISGEELTASELADVIYTIRKQTYPGTKNITIDGMYNQKNLSGMYTLTRTLKDHGYVIRVICDGEEYFPWFHEIDYITVVVENPVNWVKFESHQVVYKLKPGELSEPSLPPINNMTMLYLDVRDVEPEQVKSFLSGAKQRWNIYRPGKSYIHDKVSLS